MTTTVRRFAERAVASVRVNKELGHIYGAKLLGRNSRNGRTYSESAMRNAVPLYEGVKCYWNHPRSSEMEEGRRLEDWVGVVRNPRYESGAIFGDIHLRTKSKHYEEVLELAEQFSDKFGCSHVADGDSRMEHGEEIIESIDS